MRPTAYICSTNPDFNSGDDNIREYCLRADLHLDESFDLHGLDHSAFKGKWRSNDPLQKFLNACQTRTVASGSALVIADSGTMTEGSPDVTVRLLLEIINEYRVDIHIPHKGLVFSRSENTGIDFILASVMEMRGDLA